jgi:D-alanyl-D-alanine carboxypeptidase
MWLLSHVADASAGAAHFSKRGLNCSAAGVESCVQAVVFSFLFSQHMRIFITGVVVAIGLAVVAGAQQAVPASRATLQASLQAALDEWRASAGMPGATLGVVLPDGTALGVASGVADRTAKTPMKPDDLLLAGSTGKTFFAAVALQLIEQGTLSLDTPIAKYLGGKPWFSRLPNGADVTVRMLMTHSSGLVRYELNPKFTADLRAQPDRTWTPEEEIAYLLDAQAPFAAGKGWEYSDTNYIVLGMILEQITGTRLYDEVQRRFLTPLKLTRVVPSTGRTIAGLVPGYAGARDPLGLPDEVLQNGVFVINPQFEWTGGGYATSAPDLARWGHALYMARAVSPKMRDLMVSSAVPARLGPETGYGLGVIVRKTTPIGATWGHSGFFPGYQTELVHVVDRGVTIALQINSSAPRTPGSRPMLRAVYDFAALVRDQQGLRRP